MSLKLYINTNDTETSPINVGKMVVEYRKKLKRSMRGVQIFDAYDPNEPRESSGKWTAGGGSSKQPKQQHETTSFVSPNEDPTTLSFEQAVSGLKTKRQKLLAGISHSIDSDLGINDVRINHVVGAWADGAENSVMTNSAAADPDIEEAAAAMKGYLANQKAVLLFHPDDKGNQFLAQFRIPNNDLGSIHKKLIDNGVIFHTLEPRGNDTIVHFYGETRDDVHLFAGAAKKFDQKIQLHRGHGKFIPPEVKEDGTDAEQRAASREAYLDTIRRVGLTGKLRSGFESKWQNHIDNWERETGERIGGGQRSTDAYDPAEARDPGGRWTEGGGSGGAATVQTRGERGRDPGGSGETRTRSAEEAQRRAKEVSSAHPNLTGLLPNKPMPITGHGYYMPGPNATVKETAEKYMKSAGLPYNPPKAYNSINTERATRIAQAFDEMKHDPNDPKVKAAYQALAKETLAQWQEVKKTGLKVEWIKPDQEDPYAVTPRLSQMDVNDNNHWWGFPTDQGFGTGEEAKEAIKDNPLLEMTDEVIDGHKCCVNDIFRIVHDYFGHFKEGVGFRASGEENAWRSHASMYSREALPAVTSETRGQNSWVNYGPYGETNKTASGADTHYAPQKIGIMPEWTWREGLADEDKKTTDKYDPEQKRDPDGKWTAGGGSGGKKQEPWIEEVAEQSGVPSPSRSPWIQELAEKEKNRPGVVTKAAHAATHGAVHLLGEFSKEDYEMLHEHLKPRSKTRESHARYIVRIASTLPALLKAHFKEEYHKFKRAAGALKALATGHRPTSDQWKGLRQAATTVLLTGAVFMLTGEPTGTAAHAAEHAVEHVAEHVVEQTAHHSAVAAAQHLAHEFGHELVTHTMLEHAAKFGLGMARFGASAALGSMVHFAENEEEAKKKETKDADTDSELSDEEIKLLQDYIKTLSDVVATYPIQDEHLKASLPDTKSKSNDAYDPSEARDPSGKWTSGGGSGKKSVNVQREGGGVEEVHLPDDIVEHARHLPEAPEKYFKTETEGAQLLPVSKLVQKRARPEGIAHAVQLMAAASRGEHDKRGPIHVQELDDGNYLVLDGNSTTTIASAAGWEKIPAIVIPDESYLPKKPPKPHTKDKYDPNEKRDPSGKWTEGGGGGKAAPNTSPKHPERHPTQHPTRHPEHYEPSPEKTPELYEAPPSDREVKPPKKTVKVYKLFKIFKSRPGEVFPLFIKDPTPGADNTVPLGEWKAGGNYPTTGYAPRPGWHAGMNPTAPHLRNLNEPMRMIQDDYVWGEAEMPDDVDWQKEADKNKRWIKRRKNKNGEVVEAHWKEGEITDQIPVGGHYKFNTKSDESQGGTWVIGGALKLIRLLTDEQVRQHLTGIGKHEDAKAEMHTEEANAALREHFGESYSRYFKDDSEVEPQKKTKDSRFRFLHVHTIDRVFNFILNRDAAFDPADHPHAPEGAPEGKGGQFVSKGGKSGGGSKAATQRGHHIAGERAAAQRTAQQANTPKAPKAPKAANTPTATRAPGTRLIGSKGHPGQINPAGPKGKNNEFNHPSVALVKTDPKQYRGMIQTYKENPAAYPLTEEELSGDDDTVARNVIEHIKSNLKFVFNQTPKATRESTKKWYDGARKMVDEHVETYKQYGLKDTAVAGVYACLSPNNLWDQNVRQADQMIDIYYKHRTEPWDKKMDDAVDRTKNPVVKRMMQDIQGKKYNELDTDEKKGMWIRVYDEGHSVDNPEYKEFGYQPFHNVTPEGKRVGWYANPVNKSTNRAFAWQSAPNMAKAIKILESNGDPGVISDALRPKDPKEPPQHKVRSFYNNILDPDSDNEDVTMDTHAVDVAWLFDNPIGVAQNFGNVPQAKGRPLRWIKGTPGSVTTGVSGNYGFNADAYREAAHELGVRPRELQSIVWTTKREWMQDNMTEENHQRMRDTWEDYRIGLLTQEEAQKKCKSIIDEDLKMNAPQKKERSQAISLRNRLNKREHPEAEEYVPNG